MSSPAPDVLPARLVFAEELFPLPLLLPLLLPGALLFCCVGGTMVRQNPTSSSWRRDSARRGVGMLRMSGTRRAASMLPLELVLLLVAMPVMIEEGSLLLVVMVLLLFLNSGSAVNGRVCECESGRVADDGEGCVARPFRGRSLVVTGKG
jgi:hypothetical protein